VGVAVAADATQSRAARHACPGCTENGHDQQIDKDVRGAMVQIKNSFAGALPQ
jgi:hypothetical protein